MSDLRGLNFDANKEEPSGFDPIPAGEYPVCIVASEMLENTAGTGHYLKLELQVLGGPYQNRKVFDRLNLDNPNAQAVVIARGTLSAICRAVGVMTPHDSSELHNKPLLAKVTIRKSEEYGDQNEVKAYKALPIHQPMQPAQLQPQVYPPPPTQAMPQWVPQDVANMTHPVNQASYYPGLPQYPQQQPAQHVAPPPQQPAPAFPQVGPGPAPWGGGR